MSVWTQQRVQNIPKSLGRFAQVFFFFLPHHSNAAIISVRQMPQSPVLCHMNMSKGSVLIGQMLKSKPDKICTSSLFTSAVLSASTSYSLSVPQMIKMTANKKKDERPKVCVYQTHSERLAALTGSNPDVCSCHWADQPASFTFVSLFSTLFPRKTEKRHTKNFLETF